MDASRAIKTKSEADPETSLNNSYNNAPKCLFPSLADPTNMEARDGYFNAKKQNLKYKTKQKKTKGNVCFLFVECIASCGKLTSNYGPVEKLYCTTGKQLHSNSPHRTKQEL